MVVNTTPVKAAIDDQMNRLFDALVNSLRKAITGHMAAIDDFVESGTEALNMRPTTLDEIGVVNAKHAELSKRKPSMRPLFQKAEVKNRLLRYVIASLRTRSPLDYCGDLSMPTHVSRPASQICGRGRR